MSDLYIGLVVMVVMSVGLFVLAAWLTKSASRLRSNLLAIFSLSCLAFYICFLWDNVLLSRFLPVSDLIVVGNWFPLLCGFLAGIAWRAAPGGSIRKCVPVAILGLTGSYAVASPMFGSPPQCGDVWVDNDLCVQTTDKTCTAACAATLLKAYGIEATEQEMAELCLTRNGTRWQGLYRGLKLKTAGTEWDVEVFKCDFHELRQYQEFPMILSVGVDRSDTVDQAYLSEWGWRPGVGHSVVMFGFASIYSVEIADPAPDIGREQWSLSSFRKVWRGRGIRLVSR